MKRTLLVTGGLAVLCYSPAGDRIEFYNGSTLAHTIDMAASGGG